MPCHGTKVGTVLVKLAPNTKADAEWGGSVPLVSGGGGGGWLQSPGLAATWAKPIGLVSWARLSSALGTSGPSTELGVPQAQLPVHGLGRPETYEEL